MNTRGIETQDERACISRLLGKERFLSPMTDIISRPSEIVQSMFQVAGGQVLGRIQYIYHSLSLSRELRFTTVNSRVAIEWKD